MGDLNPVAVCPPPIVTVVGRQITVYGGDSYPTVEGVTIVSYDWDWGDSTSHGSGVTATHIYTTAGTYEGILTVTDSAGRSGSCHFPISVIEGICHANKARQIYAGDSAGWGYFAPSGTSIAPTTYNFGSAVNTAAVNGYGTFAYFGCDNGYIYRTPDGLVTIDNSYNFGASVTSVYIDPVSFNIVWVGTTNGVLFRSQDYGLSYELIYYSGWNEGILTIIVDPFNSQRVIIGGASSGAAKLEETADWGYTWNDIRSGDLLTAEIVHEVQFSNLDIGVLWVALKYTGGSAGESVQRGVQTADFTYTWTPGSTVTETEAFGITSIAFTNDEAYAVARTVNLWKTLGHPTWELGGTSAQVLRKGYSDSICQYMIWLGTNAGVYVTPANSFFGSGTWITQVFATNGNVNALALGPVDSLPVYSGMPDHVFLTGIDGAGAAYIAETKNATDLTGANWTAIGITGLPGPAGRAIMRLDPFDVTRAIWFDNKGVYLSSTLGPNTTWTCIFNEGTWETLTGFTTDSNVFGVGDVQWSQTGSGFLGIVATGGNIGGAAATRGSFIHTHNVYAVALDGTGWSNTTFYANNGWISHTSRELYIGRHNDERIYIAAHVYGGAYRRNMLYKSINHGHNFTEPYNELIDAGVLLIVPYINNEDEDILYLARSNCIKSSDGGTTFGSALPVNPLRGNIFGWNSDIFIWLQGIGFAPDQYKISDDDLQTSSYIETPANITNIEPDLVIPLREEGLLVFYKYSDDDTLYHIFHSSDWVDFSNEFTGNLNSLISGGNPYALVADPES